MQTLAYRAALFAALTAATPALAQPSAPEAGVRRSTATAAYEYRFDDDVLGAMGNFSGSLTITGHGKGARAGLVRPRAHFVPELLKSVEAL